MPYDEELKKSKDDTLYHTRSLQCWYYFYAKGDKQYWVLWVVVESSEQIMPTVSRRHKSCHTHRPACICYSAALPGILMTNPVRQSKIWQWPEDPEIMVMDIEVYYFIIRHDCIKWRINSCSEIRYMCTRRWWVVAAYPKSKSGLWVPTN